MAMAWVAGGVLLVAAAVLIAMRLPVTIELQFYKGVQNYQGHLRLSWLFGLIHAERNLLDIHPVMTARGPSVHVNVHKKDVKPEEKQPQLLTPREILRRIREARVVARELLKNWPMIEHFLGGVKVARFDTKLTFGTGDAPLTGVAYGVAWSGLATAIGLLSRYLQFERRPRIQVLPDFQRRMFDVSQFCIFRVRPGYAIAAAFRLYRLKKRA